MVAPKGKEKKETKKPSKAKAEDKETKVLTEADIRKELEAKIRAEIAAERKSTVPDSKQKCDPVTFIWNVAKRLRALTVETSEDLITVRGIQANPISSKRISVKNGQYTASINAEVDFLRNHDDYKSTGPDGFQEISDEELSVIRSFNEKGKVFKSNTEAVKEARDFIEQASDFNKDK